MSKNVVLITIDSLRSDRTGYGGHTPSPTPTIDKLAKEGLCLTKFFSTGCTTQFALPSVFTSTLPLDNGGYEYGIRDRKTSFVEVLQKNGYMTAGFFNAFYGTSFYSYDRGFKHFFELLPPLFNDIFKKNILNHLIRDYKNGSRTLGECVTILQPFMEKYLGWVRRYCEAKDKEIEENTVLFSPIIHRWDFKKISEIIKRDEAKIKENPEKYILGLLSGDNWGEVVDINYSKTWAGRKGSLAKVIGFSGMQSAVFSHFLSGKMRSLKDFKLAEALLSKSNDRVASGTYMTNVSLTWLDDNINRTEPFFLWLHLMDVHNSKFVTNDIDIDRNNKKAEIKLISEYYMSVTKEGSKYQGKMKKDLGTRYADLQIQRIIDHLKERGVYKNTIIVLTSDHGSRNSGYPFRENIDISDFYDEMYHVPALFIGESITPEIKDGLYSALDIGPTILDLLNIPADPSFKGESIYKISEGHSHLIAEDMGRGPCDFDSKPINVCVRNKTSKLVYSVSPDQKSEDGDIVQYYQLDVDHDEMTNLATSYDEMGDRELRNIAVKRVRDIRNQLETIS